MQSDVAGDDIGSIESVFKGDGIGFGGDKVYGIDMKEGGCHEVVVILAGSEEEAAESHYGEQFLHLILYYM